MRNTPLAFVGDDTVRHLGTVYDQRRRSAAVARAAGLAIDDVAENWSSIEQHKWFLSERLGRDAGMEVAALDYLENVHPSSRGRSQSVLRSRMWFGRLWQRLLENLDGDGPRSIVNLERALRLQNRLTN